MKNHPQTTKAVLSFACHCRLNCEDTTPAVMTFTYNGLSFRRTLHDGTSLTKFIYAWANGTPGIDPVLLETDVNDITVVEYTPARLLSLLSQRRGTVTKWYHPEAIGSTRQLTDNTQAVTDTYLYKAFGELVTSTGTTINPLRYVGQANYYDDRKSGSVLMGMRYYNKDLGRFMTQDFTHDGLNWYEYVTNSPVIHIDPTGLIWGPCSIIDVNFPHECKEFSCATNKLLRKYEETFDFVANSCKGCKPLACGFPLSLPFTCTTTLSCNGDFAVSCVAKLPKIPGIPLPYAGFPPIPIPAGKPRTTYHVCTGALKWTITICGCNRC